MRIIDIHGMTNMELVRGGTDEWYWATDYTYSSFSASTGGNTGSGTVAFVNGKRLL